MEPIPASEYQDYMYGLLKKVTDEIGPRPACSDAERRLGSLLVGDWTPLSDSVSVETFTCSPRAFLGFLPLTVTAYVAAVALYWFYPLATLIVSTFGLSLILLELVRYREFIDFLFPKMWGANVTATIRPKGPIERRVIVSAHQDSAYEFWLWYRLGNAALLLMALAVLAILLVFGASLARTIGTYAGLNEVPVFTIAGIVAVALVPVVAVFFFFRSNTSVPGAMDDMSGIAVLAGLGKWLGEARKVGECFPRRTEIILLATSSEEAGLRGAKRYVKKHLAEMKEIPTSAVFIDGVYDERYLTVVSREAFMNAKHDASLVRMAEDAAAVHDWEARTRWLLLGATDASAFSIKGVPSVCLQCADTSRLPRNYHTREDTWEHVRPESLTVMLQMVMDMIRRIDEG